MTRRRIRAGLTEWCRFCGFEPARHHRYLLDRLEKVHRGEIKRLAIFMPPGSAKSTYASVLFPAWVMAARAGLSVLAASHTTELAEKWGRKVRNLLSEHSRRLSIDLSADSQAAGRWSLATGGEYYAAGVGTGIAGFRAGLGIIDDPIRSRQDADSDLIRDRIWAWYKDDFLTRLVPDACQILIQTRWHEDDLAGRILDAMKVGGPPWEVISLPAVAEANDPLGRDIGEPLWDDDEYGYGAQMLELQTEQLPRTWAALYQQRPAPEEGDYFRAGWLRTYIHIPARKTLHVYGASDYAVTADGGDYTVHIVVGVDPDGNMYVLDLWRGQAASDRWVEEWCRLVKEWKPLEWAEETGQIRGGIGPFLDAKARERQAWTYRRAFPTRGDKAVRAQSIRGRMALSGLYLPSAPWVEPFRSELLSFPAGKHDDQVDALGLIGQLLDEISAGRRPEPRPKPRPKVREWRWDDDDDKPNWKVA